jgi:hypothetical protein
MTETRTIYCCGCTADVQARLTNGKEVYPRRRDLADLPFWRCDACGRSVGCHHKTKNRTAPLGCIPTPELSRARRHIHKILDPLWEQGVFGRAKLYAMISERLGWTYHTSKLRTIEEARKAYAIIREISQAVQA